jgi:hypothetical protein
MKNSAAGFDKRPNDPDIGTIVEQKCCNDIE